MFLVGLAGGGCADRIDGLIDCDSNADCPSGYCDLTSHFCFSGQQECEIDSECNPPLEVCLNGQCSQGCNGTGCALGETCNTETGRCRFLQSCTIDSNCSPPQTVCLDDYCEPGCGITGCQVGYCDPYSGHCQGGGACQHDGECAPPSTVCDGTDCVAGCLTEGCPGTDTCNSLTGRCEPAAGCSGDLQCNPPSTVCDGTTCVAGCLTAGCASGEACNPQTGRCEASNACTQDGNCSPPDTICVGYQCVAGCLTEGCTGTDTCNSATGRCQPASGCIGDSDCSPPNTICEGTQCVAGCVSAGCTSPQVCNTTTGRCETGGLKADGADCLAGTDCLSGLCRHVEVNHGSTLGWLPFDVCTTECCTESDCASGSACMYHHGTKLCIPDRIYPAAYSFSLNSGQACQVNGYQVCRSGFCNSQTGLCARTCCADSDCGGDICSWYNDSYTMWEMCRAQGTIGYLATGASCSSEYDCRSFICAGPPYQCADMCCTNNDCPGGYLCAQVAGGNPSNPLVATTACVQATAGTTPNGSSCTAGDAPSLQCASGLCAGGTCRTPCCHDSDCLSAETCTTVPSGIDVDGDSQSDYVRACVP